MIELESLIVFKLKIINLLTELDSTQVKKSQPPLIGLNG